MIDFVCFKWKPFARYRSTFLSEHVNVLGRMISRNYGGEHRLTCITDDPVGLDESIRVLPLWDDHADVPNPSAPGRGPSCYRRLKIFKSDAGQWLGRRIVQIDIDCIIVGDISPIVDRDEDFIIWGDTNKHTYYNGSLIVFTAGCRPQIWDDFDPVKSPEMTKKRGLYGSDQAWISARLGPGEKKFFRRDGVYSFRNDVKPKNQLPKEARIVIMHGAVDPWSAVAQGIPWVRHHWR